MGRALLLAVSGLTYLHLVVQNYDKFIDARALPAVYQLLYTGVDVSAQTKTDSETVLHQLILKPDAYKLMLAVLR